jgi:hypothetical protein
MFGCDVEKRESSAFACPDVGEQRDRQSAVDTTTHDNFVSGWVTGRSMLGAAELSNRHRRVGRGRLVQVFGVPKGNARERSTKGHQ